MSNREKELIYTPACSDCGWRGLPVDSADMGRVRSVVHWYEAHRVEKLAAAWDAGWESCCGSFLRKDAQPESNPYLVDRRQPKVSDE